MSTIGIDIGGTSVRAGVVSENGELLAEIVEATPSTSGDTETLLVGMIGHLATGRDITAVGLAVAGFISADCRRVMFAPHLAWRNAPVPELLAPRIGRPVVMDHDVNCAAWAEYRTGVAAHATVSLVIAVGTGIGAGLVVDGRLYRGGFGVAPELGHITLVPGGRPCGCGKRGCWERYCSGTALVDEVRDQIARGAETSLANDRQTPLTGRAVGAAARGGDPVAVAAVHAMGRRLGEGMALAADVLDPQIIVIGGGLCVIADLFMDDAQAAMMAHLTGGGHRPAPTLAVARHRTAAGMLGAALIAAERAET